MKPFIATMLALGITVVGCTATGQAPTPSPTAEQELRVSWPAAPQAARVTYLYEFSGPADLGYRESLASRFKDVLGGGEFQGMVRPYAVAANDAMLVVADPGLSAVHVFSHRSRRYALLSSANNVAFGSPVGVALAEDRIYIADSAVNRVFVLDGRYRSVQEIDGFERPTGLAYDSTRGHLYVADTHAHQVREYDRDGNFVRDLGQRGNADGQFNYPTHLAIEGESLYINDTLNFRVQMFDLATGRHVRSVGKHGDRPGYMAQPKGIAASADGVVFVAEAVFGYVQVFDLQGEFLLSFGNRGEGVGQFQLPAGLAIWEQRVYVADAGNRRIQVFEYASQD